MKKYSNLADSVHYNRSASYIPPDMTDFNGYGIKRANQLKTEMSEVLASNNTVLGFTLNQIADNPVFFQQSDISEELFDLLISLLKSKKAFISTYNAHTVSSYAINRMLSSWKRICDDEEDDLRYVSSIIEALANIKGDVDERNEMIVHYSDNIKREAHKALFGIDRLVTISNNLVEYDSRIVPIDQYLQQILEMSQDKSKYGYYTGLYFGMDDEDCLNTCNYMTRMKVLAREAYYKENNPFIRENELSLADVIKTIINTDILECLYIETIDSTLEKKIRNMKSEFLASTKEAILQMLEYEKTSRSRLYEKAFKIIDLYLRPIIGYTDNNYYKNTKYRLIMPFFFQIIDICYNYFNYLQTFGVSDDSVFIHYPYHTQNGMSSDNSAKIDKIRTGRIILTSNLFKEQVYYYVINSNNSIMGSYINFSSAKKAKDTYNNNGYLCNIIDNHGSVISC